MHVSVCVNNNNSWGHEFEKEEERVNIAEQMEGWDGGRGRKELNTVLTHKNLEN